MRFGVGLAGVRRQPGFGFFDQHVAKGKWAFSTEGSILAHRRSGWGTNRRVSRRLD